MDMGAEKTKREARIKAKQERIRNELGRSEDTGAAQANEAAVSKEEKKK